MCSMHDKYIYVGKQRYEKLKKVGVIMETLKYLRLYIKGRFDVGQSTSLSEAGRDRIARLIGCSLLEIDIAITQLKVSKEIRVVNQFVIEVK